MLQPQEVSFKINVVRGLSIDADIFAATSICRDGNGFCLGTSVLIVEGISDPGAFKALACRE